MIDFSAKNKIIAIIVGLVIFQSVQTSVLKNDVTRLRDMNHQQIKQKFGIEPKYPDKCYKNEAQNIFTQCQYDTKYDFQSSLGGIVGQYPIFMDRLFLTGDWIVQGESQGSQFGKFSEQRGEYDCAFLQDDKNNNYLIFQLVDGHYIDQPTVEALLNLTDQVSTFEITNTTFTFKSKLKQRFFAYLAQMRHSISFLSTFLTMDFKIKFIVK